MITQTIRISSAWCRISSGGRGHSGDDAAHLVHDVPFRPAVLQIARCENYFHHRGHSRAQRKGKSL